MRGLMDYMATGLDGIIKTTTLAAQQVKLWLEWQLEEVES